MKHPEQWHKWPKETPPENEPLQVKVWNDFHEEYELAVGVFHDGEFFHHDLGALALSQRLFIHGQKQVFWRLWDGEDEE